MKAIFALLVFLMFAVWIGAGIVVTTSQGNPWLLLTGTAAFVLCFARYGCLQS